MQRIGEEAAVMVEMRTEEERRERLRQRAAVLQRQRNRRQLAGFGSASAFLMVLLMASLVQMGVLSNGFHSVTDGGLAGSSLLGESAGGYVLAAVIAFFAGVIVTALCLKYRKR